MGLKMINNIFSIFDPTNSLKISLNWIRIIILIFLIPYPYWLIPSRFLFTWNISITSIFNEFKILIHYSHSNIIIFLSLIIIILFNNFLGLFPYIFTATSHLRFTLSLSLSIWLAIIIFGITNFFNNLITHLTPQGTPYILIPFIVIIETISLIIRPITLSIRLSANIIAGHLLLSLLGSTYLTPTSIIIMPIILISQILLFTLEIAVSIIQAYVFSILTTLYRSDN